MGMIYVPWNGPVRAHSSTKQTWVAGLFLEPLPSMLTSEPLIDMDLLEHLARAGAGVADLSLPHYK
jgi:hypothetical protein